MYLQYNVEKKNCKRNFNINIFIDFQLHSWIFSIFKTSILLLILLNQCTAQIIVFILFPKWNLIVNQYNDDSIFSLISETQVEITQILQLKIKIQ